MSNLTSFVVNGECQLKDGEQSCWTGEGWTGRDGQGGRDGRDGRGCSFTTPPTRFEAGVMHPDE